jgi:hypothetical protein
MAVMILQTSADEAEFKYRIDFAKKVIRWNVPLEGEIIK